jgi:leucine dehydrogenase
MAMQSLIQQWTGESVLVSYDQPTGTWIFIAIHDTTLGPAMGGCRMRVYRSADDALRDAMRLAEGMTSKWAVIGFEYGGGKSVLAVPRELHGSERTDLLQRYGRLLESLRGAYWTGEDLGTTPEDMAVVGNVSRYVHGTRPDGKRAVDPGPFTALGVLVGTRAAVTHAMGVGLEGRSVLIQGAGDVGAPLARLLAEEGARLLISDLDQGRADRVAEAVGGTVVAPDRAYATQCDVFAPCAVGAVLNGKTIPQLACKVVAGSANNQLGEVADARRLHHRGILYAPDYVVNAGGAIALPMLGQGHSEDEIRDRIRKIEGTLEEIFTEATRRNETPGDAAARRVERVLAARREMAAAKA